MAIDKNTISKEAQKFVAKGQYDKAIAEWKKLLKETSDDPNVYNTIGDLCLKKESKSEAVEAYYKAAELLAADGFTSKAIALYKKVLNIDPKKMEAHLALGDMNAEKGLTGNALESYKLVADHYTRQNQTAKALDIYQKMADLNPSNVAFQIKLGDMYAKEGMKEKSAKAYLLAADAHLSKSAYKDARQLFEKVLALDPANKEVYHKAGIVYFKEGKFVEACKALKPAFENNPSNRELANLYLEALTSAGKDSETEQVIRKLLAENTDDAGLREKLYHLYFAKKDYEKAIVEAATLADGKISAGKTGEAEEIYKAFVAGSPNYAPARQKLAEFLISVSRSKEAAAELLEAAELFIEEEDLRSARSVLAQAIEVAPELPEARKRLEGLDAPVAAEPPPAPELFTTAEEPIPAAPPTIAFEAVPAPAPSIAQAPPTAVTPAPAPPVTPESITAEEDPSVIEAINEVDVLVKYGLAVKAIEQLETLCSKFPESPRIRIKLRDLYHGQGNIDKAVRHALLAIALYSKNGRDDLAMAVLRDTHTMAPDHPAVISRLGRAPFAPEAFALKMPESALSSRDMEAAAPEEVQAPELMPDHLDIPQTPSEAPPPSHEELPQEISAPEELPMTGEIEFEELDAGVPHLEGLSTAETSPVEEMPETALRPAEEASTRTTEQEQSEIIETRPLVEAPAVAAAAEEKPPAEINVSEIRAEAEFFFQQGLFEEAKKHYTRLIALTPDDQRAIERLFEISREEDETREFSNLTEAVEGLEDYVPLETAGRELATSASDDEAVRSLMREIDQLKRQPSAPAPPPEKEIVAAPPRAAAEAIGNPVVPSQKTEEEDFFDLGEELQRETSSPRKSVPPKIEAASGTMPSAPEKNVEEDFFDLGEELQRESASASKEMEKPSDEFFDLAAELKDDLSAVPFATRSVVPAEEQSLEDIFDEFKKGVEQQAVKEDADTHYNLGVAYKEMGLLDDAIGEFILTPEDGPKFAQSRYMLGLCYMEKGEYRNAIGELQNALDYTETLGADTHNRIEMHYDLGLAYQGAGNISSAISEFQCVSEEDPGYRDTAAKLKELHKGDFISLEQLKDDIEKEISSKFLEEGVRIEREEKSKKSERVIRS